MKHTPCLARVLVLALLLCGTTLPPATPDDARAPIKERMQYAPAAVVPALGIRG